LPFPVEDAKNSSNTGYREYITDNNVQEAWIEIAKINETSYSLTDVNLS